MKNEEYMKPLPFPTSDSRRYWEGCRKHELWFPKCLSCNKMFWYPSEYCPNCQGKNHDWIKSEGKGTIYTYSIVHTPFYGKEWEKDVPYNVAIVELAEGIRLVTNIVNCKNEDIAIGLEVQVVFDDVTDEVTLPKFEIIRKNKNI